MNEVIKIDASAKEGANDTTRPEKKFRYTEGYDDEEPEYLWEDVWPTLTCVSCDDIMMTPVRECQKGHSICANCKADKKVCPLCGNRYAEVRNFSLETLVGKIPLPCKHRDRGCRFVGFVDEKIAHGQICSCQPYICPSAYCDLTLKLDEILPHLVVKHNWEVREMKINEEGDRFQDKINVDCPKEKDTFNSPSFLLEAEGWGHFILRACVRKDGTCQLLLQMLAPSNEANGIQHLIKVYSASEENHVEFLGPLESLLVAPEAIVARGHCVSTRGEFIQQPVPPEEERFLKVFLSISKKK